MELVSRVGVGEDARAALEAALADHPARADLVVVFAPASWIGRGLARRLRERFGADATLLGGSASGVIGGGREVERAAAISVTSAILPGVSRDWVELAAPSLGPGVRAVLLLAEPTAPVEEALAALAPPVVGGLVSGARQRGGFRLLADEEVRREGAVALALGGPLRVDSLVAQGCRPIGEPMIVVRSEGNAILELDQGRPLDVLRAIHRRLDARDQRLFQQALFLGVQMREQRGPYGPGDFLVRNVIGADPDRGALTVAAPLAGHPVVQLHVRDAASSTEDLERHLARQGPGAVGALAFTCLGRGEGLYGVPHHDADRTVARLFPGAARPTAPLGGLFCNGEVGPVGGRSYLHAYTTSLAIVRPPSETSEREDVTS